MKFAETRIANRLVKDIGRIYDKAKRNPINFMDRETDTIGGKQTDNALFLEDFGDLIPHINVIKGLIEGKLVQNLLGSGFILLNTIKVATRNCIITKIVRRFHLFCI